MADAPRAVREIPSSPAESVAGVTDLATAGEKVMSAAATSTGAAGVADDAAMFVWHS